MKKILVVAPHADDETLGCGGTLLRHINSGDEVHWLLITCMSKMPLISSLAIDSRAEEIHKVANAYPFNSTIELKFQPAHLDTVDKSELITAISGAVNSLRPQIIYSPYRNDAHSDHEMVFDALMACTKSFRCPFIERVLVYETLSETEFGLKPEDAGFKPNVFVDVFPYIDKKIEILSLFKSEIGQFPFPRSIEAVKALSMFRGAQCGAMAAESFMLLKEIIR